MEKLREAIGKSSATNIGDILTGALSSLKDNAELKKVYGDVFISGFIDESQSFISKNNVLTELSSEYADNDDSRVVITGFIYDGLIADANITILDGETKVGEVKSSDKGRWKISIKKTTLKDDKVLVFTGTAIDENGDKILLKSAITTEYLREIAKKRISATDIIDLVISNVTTAQFAILKKNDRSFIKKPKLLEENKNKIEIFQQDLLLKSSAAIKAIIDGNATINTDEDTYSFVLNNLVVVNAEKNDVELQIDEQISQEELDKQSEAIKEDTLLSKQLLNIKSEKSLTPLLNKSLYRLQYNIDANVTTKKYKEIVISEKNVIVSFYVLEGNQWKKMSSNDYSGELINNVFYFDSNSTIPPLSISLKDDKLVHSIELNKDYKFNVLGKEFYQPYNGVNPGEVTLDFYAESFDIVTVFKELEDQKIVKALGVDYSSLNTEAQNLKFSRYIIENISKVPDPFDRNKTKLTSAISILENMDTQSDDIGAKLENVKTILDSADKDDKDAQVGKALFALADITNSETVGNIVDITSDGSNVLNNEHLAVLLNPSKKDNLEARLREISDLSETSMDVVHDIVLKLQDINQTLGTNFSDESYTFNYKDFNLTNHQSKLLRVSVLMAASELEYLTAFNYVTLDDVKTRTTTFNGTTAEYTNISANPLAVFNREDVGSLNSSIATERLKNAKLLFLEALSLLETVNAQKEDDVDTKKAIIDAQAEVNALRASLNGSALYMVEDTGDYGTRKTYTDLNALYSISTALDLTHTFGHDFKYARGSNYQYGYRPGTYSLELSQFYNEPMAQVWVHESNGSTLAYDAYDYTLPKLDIEPKSVPTGSNSHIPSIVKKIEIIKSGETTKIHTGDNVLKYLYNDLDINGYSSTSSTVTYSVNKNHYLIPDTTVRFGVKVLYGNVELINTDPVKGQVTVQALSGYNGNQYFELEVYDSLGHSTRLHGSVYASSFTTGG